MNTQVDHATFREQMATALTGGLSAEEQSRFDAHLATCDACAAEYAQLKRREDDLVALFENARPAAGFEDRLIQSLRQISPRRNWVHPMVRRAATGVAAAILLGSAGYVINTASNGGTIAWPWVASNLRHIGLARLGYSNESLGPATQPVSFDLLRSSADYDGDDTRWDVKDLNKGLLGGLATGRVADARKAREESEKTAPLYNAPAATPSQRAPSGTATNGRYLFFGDGQTNVAKNPVSGGQRNNIAGQDRGGETTMGRSQAKSQNGDDSVLVPTDEFGIGKDPALGTAGLPAVVPFKPQEVAAKELQVTEHEQRSLSESLAQESPRGRSSPKTELGQVVQTNEKAKPQDVKQVVVVDGTIAAGTEMALAGDQENAARPPAQASPPAPAQPQTEPAASTRKVIRTGVMEFEVDRFDAALAMITKLTQEAGGYVGTTDSEKLPNGKVKGTVTVRVPPDRLDTLVMQLRGIGDLRSQKMDAQDVTKQYTDLEGELRAARAMEERLLEIIKTGKGEIKDLLAAEKELGVWRGKIEKITGEMKYYDNLVSLTTLTVTIFERDIRTAAMAKETETVDAGIETDDVENARAAALKAIDEAKGRVIQSDLKRHDAGQFSAVVVADVSPDASGPLVDRLKQLGKVARFEVQRKQTTPDGTTQPAPGSRLERADTRINLSLYNLANVAPRQTTNLNLAATDVETAYKAIAARVTKAGGRVVTSNLSRPQAEQVVGAINFEVKAADADAVLGDIRALGEVMRLTVTENADTNNVTTAKQGFVVQIASIAVVPVRESTNLQIATPDVPDAYNKLRDAVRATSARVTTAQLNEAQHENVTATLDFEVMRADLPNVEEAIKKLGDITQRTSGRSGDTENTVDSKVRLQVSFIDADQLPPRETTALGIETADPDKAVADLQALAQSLGGRVLQSNLSQERGGQTIGKLVVDVPLARSVEFITRAKSQGSVRMVQSTKDAQVPEGALARARVDMTYATNAALVSADQGLWTTIRRGLATSITGLTWSLQLIVIGLCFVGPWVLVLVVLWKLLKRRRPTAATVPATG